MTYMQKCAGCGITYEARREGSQYHSNACRAQTNRDKAKSKLENSLELLRRFTSIHPDDDALFAQLQRDARRLLSEDARRARRR